jgi:septum formation topological specificity factor MinE
MPHPCLLFFSYIAKDNDEPPNLSMFSAIQGKKKQTQKTKKRRLAFLFYNPRKKILMLVFLGLQKIVTNLVACHFPILNHG